MNTRRRTALAWLGTLAAAGCASSAPPSWYSLVPPAPPAPPEPPATPPALALAVARIAVPEEVDRPQLVLRRGDGVQLLETQRWSEPLKAQLPRALALALGQRLPRVRVSAWPADAAADWRLAVELQRFELHAGASPHALLVAWWSLQGPGAQPPVQRSAVLRQDAGSGSPTELANAMTRNLAALGDQVAQSLCGVAAC